MSTIEEAREQAREALTTISKRMAGSRLGKSTMREMDADILALRAADATIRALLDATEPPAQAEPAEDEREALKYLCRRHAACRSTGWPPYFEHSVGCAEWNSGRVAEEARR